MEQRVKTKVGKCFFPVGLHDACVTFQKAAWTYPWFTRISDKEFFTCSSTLWLLTDLKWPLGT